MFEALDVACVIAPIMAIAWLVIDLVRRGSPQVLLCMECEQCAGVCPISRKTELEFAGPREIMSAAKVGNPLPAIGHGALLCNECGACERICPRGLAPYSEVAKWRETQLDQTGHSTGQEVPVRKKVEAM